VPELDAVRFDNQKINWTLKEFDVIPNFHIIALQFSIRFRIAWGWLHSRR